VVAAIIAGMGWRRAYMARYGQPQSRIVAHRGRAPQVRADPAESPKLWDLWTNASRSGKTVDYSDQWRKEIAWENVMPVAVCPLIDDHHPVPAEDKAAAEVVHPRPTSGLVAFRSRALERLAQFRHTQPETAVVQQNREGDMTVTRTQNDIGRASISKERCPSSDNEHPEELRRYKGFQVTMAIALPKSREDDVSNREVENGADMHEYSIGICQVSWGEGKDSSESTGTV